tara:strand:+ start:577 stop:768 length:192 start_codon:yes stop_codon:yes gene_type:complete
LSQKIAILGNLAHSWVRFRRRLACSFQVLVKNLRLKEIGKKILEEKSTFYFFLKTDFILLFYF